MFPVVARKSGGNAGDNEKEDRKIMEVLPASAIPVSQNAAHLIDPGIIDFVKVEEKAF